MIVMGDPLLRFLWIVATLFLTFYGISASGSFPVWTRFGYMAVITLPHRDRQMGHSANRPKVWTPVPQSVSRK